MFKGKKTGKEEEEHRQLIARTGSTPWGRNMALFTAFFPFYDFASAWPKTVQQERMETWKVTYLPLSLATFFPVYAECLEEKKTSRNATIRFLNNLYNPLPVSLISENTLHSW